MSIYKSCIKLCPNCRKNCNDNNGIEDAYLPYLYDDDYECPKCESQLLDTKITIDEFSTIQNISNTIGFLEAMIELKEKDIIEYNLKMSQFKTQIEQQKTIKQEEQKSDNQRKCKHCGSTQFTPVRRKWSPLMGFLTNKTDLVCNNCGKKVE